MNRTNPDDQPIKLPYKIKLNEKPCTVKYVEKFEGFVVGTYDCLPDIADLRTRFPALDETQLKAKYKHINHRIGSLNFLDNISHLDGLSRGDYKLQVVHECQHGGIFDMVINEDGEIYVAHANGYIARYTFDSNFKSFESIKVTGDNDNETLLTSIDICDYITATQISSLINLVGDSKGRLTLVEGRDLGKVIATCDITTNGDPVWQAKFAPRNCNGLDTSSFIVLIASEDSSWYIYAIKDLLTTPTFHRLYQNRDFQAGVTSICFPRLKGSQDFSVLLGSYDESIKYYKIKSNTTQYQIEAEKLIEPPIEIEGGGIWRLCHLINNDIYISAMYAGTWKLDLGLANQMIVVYDSIVDLEDIGMEAGDLAPLHYGVDLCRRDKVVCIVDYNNSYCIFVDQGQS